MLALHADGTVVSWLPLFVSVIPLGSFARPVVLSGAPLW